MVFRQQAVRLYGNLRKRLFIKLKSLRLKIWDRVNIPDIFVRPLGQICPGLGGSVVYIIDIIVNLYVCCRKRGYFFSGNNHGQCRLLDAMEDWSTPHRLRLLDAMEDWSTHRLRLLDAMEDWSTPHRPWKTGVHHAGSAPLRQIAYNRFLRRTCMLV